MSEGIVIYAVPDDVNNDHVQRRVGMLPGVSVHTVMCPPSVRDLYRVPFLTDEDGGRHFGVEGIERFVARRLKAQGVS